MEFDQGNSGLPNLGKVKVLSRTVERNSSVLVDVTEGVEPPQKTAPDCCGVRSMVRLKSFDDADCIRGNSSRLLFEASPGLPIVDFEDGKLGSLGIADVQFGQRPNQLIEGGPQAV
jgi:hypothetical protein